ncbi:hypothetical protein D3C79_415060 [compost metagenome]
MVLGVFQQGLHIPLALVQSGQGAAKVGQRLTQPRNSGDGLAQLLTQVLGADLPVQHIEDGGDVVAGLCLGGDQP